jgi:hypothetical protein
LSLANAIHLRPDIVNEHQSRRSTNIRTIAPEVYSKPAPNDVFDIFVRTPPGHGHDAFQAVLVYHTGNSGVDYGIVMLGNANATVERALADLLKKTCRRVGETTQGLVALFERSEAQRQHNQGDNMSRVVLDASDSRDRDDRSAGYNIVCEAGSSGRNIELALNAPINSRDNANAEPSDDPSAQSVNQVSKDLIVHLLEDTLLDTPSLGRKRWRSPSNSSVSETPQPERQDADAISNFDEDVIVDQAVEEGDEDSEDSTASNLGPASQWLVGSREKREKEQNKLAGLNELPIAQDIVTTTGNTTVQHASGEATVCHSLRHRKVDNINVQLNTPRLNDVATPPNTGRTAAISSVPDDLPMLDIAETEAQSNIIYLLTGKRLTVDRSVEVKRKNANTDPEPYSTHNRTTQMHAEPDNSPPVIRITPPTPSITTKAPSCPQIASTSALAIPQEINTVLPLTAKNLGAIPVAEKMKRPWGTQNDAEVAKLRVLQKQMKTMRKYLVEERMMEGQLSVTLDA